MFSELVLLGAILIIGICVKSKHYKLINKLIVSNILILLATVLMLVWNTDYLN